MPWRADGGHATAARSRAGGLCPPYGEARLLLLELGDGLDATRLGRGEGNLVARLHGVEHQSILHLEFLGRAARAGADGAALSLLDRDPAVRLVDLADRARHALL